MRVLVVGSNRFLYNPNDEAENATSDALVDVQERTEDPGTRALENTKVELAKAAEEIGRELAKRGHTILVGSDDSDDIDPSVVKGALAASPDAEIEVHLPHGFPATYPDKSKNVKNIWLQFPDWDVTVMDVVKDKADGIIAIGGRAGVVQACLSAWMLGKPVVPVGSFEGGGKIVWSYGSSSRTKFYHEGLDDAEIDRLASPWSSEESAAIVVESLEKVAKASQLSRIPRRLLFSVIGCMLVALLGWIFFLAAPYASAFGMEPGAFYLFACVSMAGLLGATVQTLRSIRAGRSLPSHILVVDVGLGIAAGVVSAMLYMLAQIAVSDGVKIPNTKSDYIRSALVISMISLFASLYLDATLSRLDRVSGSVISGKYDST